MAEANIPLNELQAMIRRFVDERDWDQFHTPKDLAISLSLESSEVLEHFLWKTNEEQYERVKTHRDDLKDEIADVFYNLLLLSSKLGVDPSEALAAKLKKLEKKYPIEKAKGSHKKYTELQG